MYNPPSEQHDTGVEGGEFVDADPQDADASTIEQAVRDADMTNGEPDAIGPTPGADDPKGNQDGHARRDDRS